MTAVLLFAAVACLPGVASAVLPEGRPPPDFPAALGPWELVATRYRAIDVTIIPALPNSAVQRWAIAERAFRGQGFVVLSRSPKWTGNVTGQLSERHPVTFSPESKVNAGFPEGTESFAWAHPVFPSVDLAGNDARPDVLFLMHGGFVFFGASGKVLGIFTVVHEARGGIRFGKPRAWEEQWTYAIESRRFQAVTHPGLLEAGARKFAWVNPREIIEGRMLCYHGCFAFLFHERGIGTPEEWEKDCYFPFIPEDEHLLIARSALTLFVNFVVLSAASVCVAATLVKALDIGDMPAPAMPDVPESVTELETDAGPPTRTLQLAERIGWTRQRRPRDAAQCD